ncbi:hypothetical protein Tco_0418499 [Tanacetum coccineum]
MDITTIPDDIIHKTQSLLEVAIDEKMMDYSSKEFEEMPDDEMKYISEEENEGSAPEEEVVADKIIDEMIREDANVNSPNGSPPMTTYMPETTNSLLVVLPNVQALDPFYRFKVR